jgi:hypothetical protein
MTLFKLNSLKNVNLQKMMLLVVCVVLVGYIVFSLVKRNNKEDFYFQKMTLTGYFIKPYIIDEIMSNQYQIFDNDPLPDGSYHFDFGWLEGVDTYVYINQTEDQINEIKASLAGDDYITVQPMPNNNGKSLVIKFDGKLIPKEDNDYINVQCEEVTPPVHVVSEELFRGDYK